MTVYDQTRLALGTAQFGLPYGIANQAGQVSRKEVSAMLQLAVSNGIDTLDTAIAYGESEVALGQAGTQGFNVVTKLPALPDDCLDVISWVMEQVDASFTRLGVSSVYALLLHRPEQLLGPHGKELYEALYALKERGKVQKVGVSIYNPLELDALTRLFHFDLVQAPFNIIDSRLYRAGWLQRLKDDEVEIHTRSAFLQGLLLMPEENLPSKFTPWSDLFQRWHTWQAEHHVSALHACLAFSLSFPEIDRVIVGADSINQLDQIIKASRLTLPDNLPDLYCEAENLINPARWSCL
ncbi:MAG: aldo/keto reductase [Chlorobium sp.]|nr:MAG: aldo/keto reductase [Chlorobium sp.]